jgi:carbamoyl-phosphate synthase large subunit
VLIEESLLGWKEYEMEVVRDRNDNAIIICSIENVDPMGVHTGDSITVAPALTLTDKEYQIMRNASIAGAARNRRGNRRFERAVRSQSQGWPPDRDRDEPARVALSALASKATGFPIAKVAAKLAVGYTLDEITNDITGATPGQLRADHRLCRDQDPALRVREVQGRGAAASAPR